MLRMPMGSPRYERPYRDSEAGMGATGKGIVMADDDGYRIFVGIDWGTEAHQVWVTGSTGQPVGHPSDRSRTRPPHSRSSPNGW